MRFAGARMSRFVSIVAVAFPLLLADLAWAQGPWETEGPGWGRGGRRGWRQMSHYPQPERDIYPNNEFIFARVQYSSYGGRWGWDTDYPDSDLNFPIRLAELTTIQVPFQENGDPKHVVINLTDEALYNYPFIYMLEVGQLDFSEEEVKSLRDYLLRGGFLLVDDFWGKDAWENWQSQIERVFPPDEYPIYDLPKPGSPNPHPIFNIVFQLNEVPQIPAINVWMGSGRTYEGGRDTMEPHLRGIEDKNKRLMVVMAHNTDLGDGWEREGENQGYFEEFSVKKAYPLGINIVVYAMTH